MITSNEFQRQKLTEVLAALDEKSRLARAMRVEWLSLHERQMPPAVVDRAETLQLMQEARAVFIDGHFVATLMLAMSYIEHTMVQELLGYGLIGDSPYFSTALELAKTHKVFPADWITRAKTLSLRRNPFAHIKPSNHAHGLGSRIRTEKRHPIAILEQDAKDAVSLMYDFFVATLRESDGSDD